MGTRDPGGFDSRNDVQKPFDDCGCGWGVIESNLADQRRQLACRLRPLPSLLYELLRKLDPDLNLDQILVGQANSRVALGPNPGRLSLAV